MYIYIYFFKKVNQFCSPKKIKYSTCNVYRIYKMTHYMHINVCMKRNKNSKIKNKNKIINIIMAWNHAKASSPILSQTRLLIFLFCKFL